MCPPRAKVFLRKRPALRRSSPKVSPQVTGSCHFCDYPGTDVKLAAAAPSLSGSAKQYNPNAPDWLAPGAQEYLPQSYSTIPAVSLTFSLVFIRSHFRSTPLSSQIRMTKTILLPRNQYWIILLLVQPYFDAIARDFRTS